VGVYVFDLTPHHGIDTTQPVAHAVAPTPEDALWLMSRLLRMTPALEICADEGDFTLECVGGGITRLGQRWSVRQRSREAVPLNSW
jgi:hypothetical protein